MPVTSAVPPDSGKVTDHWERQRPFLEIAYKYMLVKKVRNIFSICDDHLDQLHYSISVTTK